MVSRRTAIKAGAIVAASFALGRHLAAAQERGSVRKRVPLIHITDLYDPPQDPDDHIDLATVAALAEYDLQGVVLDPTRRFLVPKPEGWDIAREPGFVSVKELGRILGREIPVAAGPVDPLESINDGALDQPKDGQAGIRLLLDLLSAAPEPVTISIVGSCRALAAAWNREPELLKAKTRTILLNAGSTGGPKREWNVGLDPFAYEALWRSNLPIDWYPCGTERSAFDAANDRGTYWKVSHETLFAGLPGPVRAWFCHAFEGFGVPLSNPAAEASLAPADCRSLLFGERNMWATISLVMGAGRVLAQTREGWRFVTNERGSSLETWPIRLDPISASIDSEARVKWEVTAEGTNRRLFGRRPGTEYGTAMGEALGALLGGIRPAY